MAKYRLAAIARRDLEDIWDYIAKDSAVEATTYVELIISKFQKLAETPKMGRTPELQDGIRSLPVKSHVIFYRNTGDRIEIIRVLSAYRDLPEYFH